MAECQFTGQFPFAQAALADPGVPIAATIEGWSPFIPGNLLDVCLKKTALVKPSQSLSVVLGICFFM